MWTLNIGIWGEIRKHGALIMRFETVKISGGEEARGSEEEERACLVSPSQALELKAGPLDSAAQGLDPKVILCSLHIRAWTR